jgi:hypothetical protein
MLMPEMARHHTVIAVDQGGATCALPVQAH